MAHTITPVPRGSNQYPWVLDLPFNPADPFNAGALGCLCNSGSVADPAASAFRHLISAGTYNGSGDGYTAGSLNAIVNPTDLGVGYYYWTGSLDPADMVVLRPYLVKYSDSTHTALATAATVAALTATLSFWTTHSVGSKKQGRALEYAAEFVGSVVVTNAITRVNSATLELPTGAQFCDAGSVSIDKSISPGIRFKGDSTAGALEILFDQQGGSGLIVQVSSLTSTSVGCGWLRRHL